MTELNKPVLRKVCVGSNLMRHDPLIITIHPSGFIGVRELGRRAQYKVDLRTVVSQAVQLTVRKMEQRTRELRQQQGLTLAQARKKARQEVLAAVEK